MRLPAIPGLLDSRARRRAALRLLALPVAAALLIAPATGAQAAATARAATLSAVPGQATPAIQSHTKTSEPALVGAMAVKPKPTAPPGVPVGRTVVPKPHSGARAVRPMVPWTLTLTASPPNPWVTQYSTITATANQDVGPTPYFILIFDTVLGGPTVQVAACGHSSTCSVAETGNVFIHDFVAYIAPYSTTDPPANAQARSNDVYVSWQSVGQVGLSATANTVRVGASSTLIATTGVDVGPSPFYIQIWDTSTPSPTLLNECGFGTSCRAPVTQTAATTHTYVATVAAYATTYPPPALQSTSLTTYITWNNFGWAIWLSATSSSPAVTATANADVGPTPYYIYIVDEASGTVLVVCASGTTCTFNEYSSRIPLTAFIASSSPTASPSGIVASSNTVVTTYEHIP